MGKCVALALVLTAACTNSPATAEHDPPTVTVTSPARSYSQSGAGALTVTGIAKPDLEGTPLARVLVNGTPAQLAADGTFSATIDVPIGASFIHTEVDDTEGGVATDTRSIEAGAITPVGGAIDDALLADISANGFSQIAAFATTAVNGIDYTSLIAAANPVQHSGDPNGPDCLFEEVFVDSVGHGAMSVSLVPVSGGLQLTLEVDALDVKGHVNYAAACVNGSEKVEVSADKAVLSGTIEIAPGDDTRFATTLASPDVALTNFKVSASGVPGDIMNMIDFSSMAKSLVTKQGEAAMGPLVNTALGSLAGTHQLSVASQTVDISVYPSSSQFDAASGLVGLGTSFAIEGIDPATTFVAIGNGTPALNAGNGAVFGLSNDLVNEALAELTASGALAATLPETGGVFDAIQLAMTSPPMVSADAVSGQVQIYIPDAKLTFLNGGKPVADAYLNAALPLAITPSAGGTSVGIALGTPTVQVDVGTDIPNATPFSADDLAKLVELGLDSQIAVIGDLLGAVPLPTVEGMQLDNVSVTADRGYVMAQATLL